MDIEKKTPSSWAHTYMEGKKKREEKSSRKDETNKKV